MVENDVTDLVGDVAVAPGLWHQRVEDDRVAVGELERAGEERIVLDALELLERLATSTSSSARVNDATDVRITSLRLWRRCRVVGAPMGPGARRRVMAGYREPWAQASGVGPHLDCRRVGDILYSTRRKHVLPSFRGPRSGAGFRVLEGL